MARVQIVPTLAVMAEIYRLPREGGAASPRFTRYLDAVREVTALSAYNPMAGTHALESTEQLLALQAETVAMDAAREAVHQCGYSEAVTLAVVLCAPGLWTDRLATEIQHRTMRRGSPGVGLVLQWSRETPTAEVIRREAIAEAVRVMAGAAGERSESVTSLLHREGLAYALGGNPYGPMTAQDESDVANAIDVLGNSQQIGDLAAVLYGDAASATLGWAPASVSEFGGYRWAIDRAAKRVAEVGAPATLREVADDGTS